MARYRILAEDGIYFTTHTLVEWLPVFKEDRYFQIIIQSLKHCQAQKGLRIFGYVIMPTHFHLLGQTKEGVRFQDVMRDMKKFTSKQISKALSADNQRLFLYVFQKAAEREKGERNYKIWQDEYHPQIIYSERVCRQKLQYMHNNPVEKGFVDQPEFWRYSSARNYILGDHSVLKVELLHLL